MADLTPYPTIPGGYTVANETASDFRYTLLAAQAAFFVEARGLLPSTLHSVFFENKRVANTLIKPLNGNLGDLLYTDENGKVSFWFYYNSDVQSVTAEEAYAEKMSRLGGDKELVIATANSEIETLPDLYENIFTSYAKKNIFFKTTKVSELPVKSNYTFAYPLTPSGGDESDNGGRLYDEDRGLWYVNNDDGGRSYVREDGSDD